MARHRVNIGEMINGTGGSSATTCPACGRERGFLESHTYNTQGRGYSSRRECRFCLHSETMSHPKSSKIDDMRLTDT